VVGVGGEGDAAALIRRLALLQRRIVESATCPKHALKPPFLFRCRLKFLLECLADGLLFHRYLFCLIGAQSARATAWKRLTARVETQRLAAGSSPFCHCPARRARRAWHGAQDIPAR